MYRRTAQSRSVAVADRRGGRCRTAVEVWGRPLLLVQRGSRALACWWKEAISTGSQHRWLCCWHSSRCYDASLWAPRGRAAAQTPLRVVDVKDKPDRCTGPQVMHFLLQMTQQAEQRRT